MIHDFGQWACIGFTATRARRNDPQTSKDAAANAATSRAPKQRIAIREALQTQGPMTCKQLAAVTGIDYIKIGKRASECGLVDTGKVLDGCRVLAV